MGKRALDGLDGVHSVESGFRGFTEINTVIYDPSRITVEKMEKALKDAGTYRKTLQRE
ncbi:MAG: heavy metal-associated domain-containing protein [bacterium]|nr:heavy metal-associated domain-containing protein [bacterium]